MSTDAIQLDERGRALLRAEYDNMLACVRCALCLTSCPTYVLTLHEAEGPRGRVAMARALVEGHLAITPDLVEHEMNCLVCDACSDICPAGVHMDPIQVALRAAIEPAQRRGPLQGALRETVFRGLFGDMANFRRLAGALWIYQASGLQWLARNLGILRLMGLAGTESLLPDVDARAFVPNGEVYPAENGSTAETVSFFAGCVMSTALADVDRATVRVLQRAGCSVRATTGQGCCGALNAHEGDLEGAKAMARRNVEAFEDDGGPIVVNAAGCGAMLKSYGHLLQDDLEWAERAASVAARVVDLSEALVGRELPVKTGRTAKVAYQDACHLLHAQRIGKEPRALLRAVPGLELCEIAEPGLCCGSAGVYNVTNPDQATQLQQRKVDNILAVEPDVVVTTNPGCLIQVQAGLAARGSKVRVKHLAEVLDEATGQ